MVTNTSGSSLAAAMIEGWKVYQDQLVTIVEGLASEQLAARIAPNLRPIYEAVAHLISARAFWFAKVLQEGDEETLALVSWDDEGQPQRTPAEYARALRVSWQSIEQAIARWTDAELGTHIVLPWIGPEHPVTRPFIVWHILEHDLHHGGEITHALGTLGLEIFLPPPPPKD